MFEPASQLSVKDIQLQAQPENVQSADIKPEQLSHEPQAKPPNPEDFRNVTLRYEEVEAIQQEVHALADSFVPEHRTSDPPAQRESVFDEQGKIVDIAFTQNGKKATLKSVLPGSYTMKSERNEGGKVQGHAHYYDGNYVTLEEPDEPEKLDTTGETNLTLLHEGGHMVDYAKNISLYTPLERTIWLADAKMQLAYNQKVALTEGRDAISEEHIEAIRSELAEGRNRFTPEEFQEVMQEFDQAVEHIGANTSVDDLSKMVTDQRRLRLETSARVTVLKERNAWANALKAMRQLSAQGIHVFTGTRDELHREITGSLGSYELTYKLLFAAANSSVPPPQFVKKRF